MVLSDEQVAADRSVPRRRRKGIGGRRWWAGTEVAATPFMEWKHRGGGSVGGAVAAVSARKLAASLRKLAATTDGGGSVRWQCGLSFDRLGFEFCSSVPIPKFATEGVTKWDYCNARAWDDVSHFQSNVKLSSTAYGREAELFRARKRVDELEEKASCMRTEHQKMCSVIKDLADGVERERRNCKKMDMINSKLLRDIAETKLSARRFIQNLEKEKRAREELEDVCESLAKEIKGNKAEIGALRNQQKRIQLEVEEERKMLQIAEVWREEQAQMKIDDAKLILEDKYAEISNRIDNLMELLRRLNLSGDVNVMSKAKALRKGFDSVNIQRVKNFTCRLPRSDNAFSIINDSEASEAEKGSGDHCFSHDQAHHGSQKSEASEISSVSLMQSKKKGSSAERASLPRNKDTCKSIMIDGSSDRSIYSTISIASPKGKSGEREPDNVGRNPHVVRAMKGHVEWPRGIRRHGLAANLLKAKFERQKTLLRNVLKQGS